MVFLVRTVVKTEIGSLSLKFDDRRYYHFVILSTTKFCDSNTIKTMSSLSFDYMLDSRIFKTEPISMNLCTIILFFLVDREVDDHKVLNSLTYLTTPLCISDLLTFIVVSVVLFD